MDIRNLTPRYAVTGQIDPSDMTALADRGFVAVIDNRPDDEVGAALSADPMGRAAAAAGLAFHFNPVVNGALHGGNVAAQAALVAASDGPVLAYCRSGTRSCVVWALGEAGSGQMTVAEILDAAAAAGYDLTGLRGQLEAAGGSAD